MFGSLLRIFALGERRLAPVEAMAPIGSIGGALRKFLKLGDESMGSSV